jgi:hypothetical protein
MDFDFGHDVKPEDYEFIGRDIQKKLHEASVNHLVPAIRDQLASNDYDEIGGIPVRCYPFEKLALLPCTLKGAFTEDEQYDLYKMCFIVLPWLQGPLSKILAQESVGAAIRICKAIGKPEYADQFNEIVKGCFVPDEHQKELGPIKKSFFNFRC